MADGAKSPIGGTFEDINESVVKPVIDGVGQAIEVGLKSIVNPNPQPDPTTQPANPGDPSPTMSKEEEEKQLLEARRKVKWYRDLEEAQKKVREEANQKQMQSAQVKQEETEIKQFEVQKKEQKDLALEQAKTKTEVRGGVGG